MDEPKKAIQSLYQKTKVVHSFSIQNCQATKQDGKQNSINKMQVCCSKKQIAIGTENGKVYMFDVRKNHITKYIDAEPWLSSIENCRGVVWTSGKSRSLMCIRVKDNKKIFHTNTNTKFNGYNGKGLQILQEKVVRYFFYNSVNSSMRIMNSGRRKIILRFSLIEKMINRAQYEHRRVSTFKVDDVRNLILFSYERDPTLYIYSYVKRTIIQQLRTYESSLEDEGRVIMRFTCGNNELSGLACSVVCLVKPSGEKETNLTLFEYNQSDEEYAIRFTKKFPEIKGEVINTAFFRNCTQNEIIIIHDDEGFVYIYKVRGDGLEFFDLLKQNNGSYISDMICANDCVILSTSDGSVNIFRVEDLQSQCTI